MGLPALSALLPYVPAAIEGSKTLIEELTRKKRKSFRDTALGKRLAENVRTGLYPPAVRNKIIGRFSKNVGSAAAIEKADIRGGLVAGGVPQTSIARVGELAKPGIEAIGKLGDFGSQLDIEDAAFKRSSADALAVRETAFDEGARIESNQARGNLISGLVKTGVSAIQGYNRNKLANLSPEQIEENPALAYTLAADAGVRIPYGGFRLGRGVSEAPSIATNLTDAQFSNIVSQVRELLATGKREEAKVLIQILRGQ